MSDSLTDCPKCGGKETLQQWYECAIDSNWDLAVQLKKKTFGVRFSAGCRACDFTFGFKTDDPLTGYDK